MENIKNTAFSLINEIEVKKEIERLLNSGAINTSINSEALAKVVYRVALENVAQNIVISSKFKEDYENLQRF